MTRKSPHVLLALLLLMAGSLVMIPSLYAKNSSAAPAKEIRQVKLKRYDECRKTALKNLKKTSISKEKFASDLALCKDRFPAANLYTKCKKDRLKEIRGGSETDITNYCYKVVENIEYRPGSHLPFAVEDGQLFFAGIGLNQPQTLSDLNPPNFNCKKLATSPNTPTSLQYILFGNHPRHFSSLSKEGAAALRRLFPISKPSPKGVDLAGYGRVYGDPGKASATVYFPSGGCSFEGPLGEKLSGLSANYLIDQATSLVVPYFGIVYYDADAMDLTTKDTAKQLARILGPSFKVQNKPKNPATLFVASQEFAEIDDEQDPKNLCKLPRTHTYLGVVQGQSEAPQKPSFALVANIKNLCEFGDKVTEPRVH